MKPGVIVLTFQVPSLRAVVFFFLLFFSGAGVNDTLVSFSPKPHAPGGAAPYWPGSTQLEAGGSCPVKLRGLLPPLKIVPGAELYVN